MMKLLAQVLTAGLLLVILSLSAQEKSEAFAHEASDVPVDTSVRWGRLPNGLRYAIKPHAGSRASVSMQLGVMAGSLHEREDQRGLAHFLEHLAFNGSARWPKGSLPPFLQQAGMRIGADINAVTRYDRTLYQLELPPSRADLVDKAFSFLADVAGGLHISQEAIEQERGIILSEARERDSLAAQAGRSRQRVIARDHLTTHREPIGLKEVIEKAQRAQFLDYYDTWYRPERMVLVVVGDIDAAKIEAEIGRWFGALKPRGSARVPPDVGQIKAAAAPSASFHQQPAAAAVSMAMDFILPHGAKGDSASLRRTDMAEQVVVNALSKRIADLSNAPGGAVLGGRAQLARERQPAMNVLSIDWTCRDASQWKTCQQSVVSALHTAVSEGLTENEIKQITAGGRQFFEERARVAAARPSQQVAGELINSIFDGQVFALPSYRLSLFQAESELMTAKRGNALLRELLPPQAVPYLWATGPSRIDVGAIVAAYSEAAGGRARAASASLPATPDLLSPNTADRSQQPGAVVQTRIIGDLGVSSFQLSNGAQLHVKRMTAEPGTVRVAVRWGRGLLSAPAELPGLPLLVSHSLVRGGLPTASLQELEAKLAGRGVRYQFGLSPDAFVLRGSTTATDLPLQLEVLAAFMAEPAFRTDAARQVQAEMDGFYESLKHDLGGPLQREVPLVMLNGDARFGVPDKRDVQQRTPEEARAWMKRSLQDGPAEVVVVGDVDVDVAAQAVARTFGAVRLSQRPASQVTDSPKLRDAPTPVQQQYRVQTGLSRALLDIRWVAMGRPSADDAVNLEVLGAVFAERVRKRLRDDLNLAYAPSARTVSMPALGRTEIQVTASAPPEQLPAAVKAVLQQAEQLAAHGPDADELEAAKGLMKRDAQRSELELDHWTNRLLFGEADLNSRLAAQRQRLSLIAAIDRKTLGRIARSLLDPIKAFQFTVLPEPVVEVLPEPAAQR